MNLLMNSAQAIEDHGHITILTGKQKEHVWIEVEDAGKGIKPEHKESIPVKNCRHRGFDYGRLHLVLYHI